MRNNKAFTLIELLAVILILGIIALIAIPTVSNILSESKKSSLKETAQTIVNTISDQCNSDDLTNKSSTYSYYISGGTATPALNVSGKLPTDGVANVSGTCDVEMVVISGNYCATKSYGTDRVEVGTVRGDECVLSNGTSIESPIATTPSSCYIYTETGEITGYHFEDTSCPNEINIPDQINGVTITSIADAAFLGDYDYMIYGNNYTKVMDTSNNFDYYSANFKATYGFDLTVDYAFPVSNVDSVNKKCYANPTSEGVTVPINYELTGSDGYTYCSINNADVVDSTVNYSNITKVNLGNAKHLNSIGKAAFFGNSITNVLFGSIPLQTIGASAFDENQISGSLYLNNLSQLKEIEGCAFELNHINQVLLPSNLETVGYAVFYDNEISNLGFNGGTKNIGDYAFEKNNLTKLIVSDSALYIGEAAFADNFLTSLNLGSSLKCISNYAFYGMNLSSVVIPNSVECIGDGTFQNNQITNLQLGSSLQTIGLEAFNAAGTITNLTIPNSVTSIGVGAFAHIGIVNLNLGTGIKTIKNWAFYDNKITSLVIPNSLTLLEHDAFFTNNISSLTIGSGVTSLPNRAFSTNLLTTVNIPSTITTIASDTFSLNTTLKTININKAVGSIANNPWGATDATINWLG